MQHETGLDTRSSRRLWCSAALLWGIAALGVWLWMTSYEFTTDAADTRQGEQHWPADVGLELADDRPTLLFFIHPRCACTRASIRQLERTLTGTGLTAAQQPRLKVVVSLPTGAPAAWRDTDTVRSAAALPGAELVWDAEGSQASRFGAVTSGSVRLYRPDGVMLFAGGVTASRGHEGDNLGSDRLHASLTQQTQPCQFDLPVFGCRLCVAQPSLAGGEADPACRPPHSTPLPGAAL